MAPPRVSFIRSSFISVSVDLFIDMEMKLVISSTNLPKETTTPEQPDLKGKTRGCIYIFFIFFVF